MWYYNKKDRRDKNESKHKKVSLFEKLVYGSGQIGMNVMYTLFSSYVLLFYTDVVGINPAMIGGVILASKIFDGISDLIAGQLIDTHKSEKRALYPSIGKMEYSDGFFGCTGIYGSECQYSCPSAVCIYYI